MSTPSSSSMSQPKPSPTQAPPTSSHAPPPPHIPPPHLIPGLVPGLPHMMNSPLNLAAPGPPPPLAPLAPPPMPSPSTPVSRGAGDRGGGEWGGEKENKSSTASGGGRSEGGGPMRRRVSDKCNLPISDGKLYNYCYHEWCFRPRFCTVRLYWAGDNLG